MKLIPAVGSLQMQKALSQRPVNTIVAILLQYRLLAKLTSRILETYERHKPDGLEEALEALCISQSNIGTTDELIVPPHVDELAQTLWDMYQQPDQVIRYQRGAIVELFTYELVRSRCKEGECYINHRFVDGRYTSDQIDVAVLSDELQRLEAYECKLKVNSIQSADCGNLRYLADLARKKGYEVHIGIVSFDESSYMKRKLKQFPTSRYISLYGLDNLDALQKTPF